MTSSQAMSILSSHPAMAAIGGLLAGGGGALAHNAISQPTLDEYGNVVESNDINPFLAAAGGAAIGGLGSYGYQKLKGIQNPVAQGSPRSPVYLGDGDLWRGNNSWQTVEAPATNYDIPQNIPQLGYNPWVQKVPTTMTEEQAIRMAEREMRSKRNSFDLYSKGASEVYSRPTTR